MKKLNTITIKCKCGDMVDIKTSSIDVDGRWSCPSCTIVNNLHWAFSKFYDD